MIIKDQQHHPVRGELVHIDLLRVRLDKPIQSTVALELEGVEEAPGVKEGGVMEHITRELNIEALPNDIPDVVRSTSRQWTSTTPSPWRRSRRPRG